MNSSQYTNYLLDLLRFPTLPRRSICRDWMRLQYELNRFSYQVLSPIFEVREPALVHATDALLFRDSVALISVGNASGPLSRPDRWARRRGRPGTSLPLIRAANPSARLPRLRCLRREFANAVVQH